MSKIKIAIVVTIFLAIATVISKDYLTRRLLYPEVVDMSKPLPLSPVGQSFDHQAFTTILKNIVKRNRVDYSKLMQNHKNDLLSYNRSLAIADISSLSSLAQLALYINAYNAFTLQLMIENQGVKSIKDIPKAKRWSHKRWRLGSQTYSLNDIEHEIIRKRYREPRIHFALVCASAGCPTLRNEAYTGAKLLKQLDEQTRLFFREKQNFILKGKVVQVSELLDWFRDDFRTGSGSLMGFIIAHAPAATKAKMRDLRDGLKITFLKYDWSLNGNW